MDASEFTSQSSSTLVDIGAGEAAFVPAPLPPRLEYGSDLVLALSHADAALSELAGLGRYLPNPHLLITPYVQREAVLSSRIEGTRTSFSELLLEEVEERPKHEDADVREVRNYITALEYGIERLRSLPISVWLVREMHARLMAGVRGEKAHPGEFRTEQNWIGPPGSTLTTAHFVPPPPAQMLEALYQWEQFVNQRGTMPELVQCALMHQQFETIHPFMDGNGRLGRLLITLFLMERGRLPQPLFYLSAYFEAQRQEYYGLLQRVRTVGDWASWLRFFLEGTTEIAQAAIRQAGQLMDMRETYRERYRGKAKVLELLDHLFKNPYTTASRAASVLGVSPPTARAAIATLESNGLLTEVTGNAWGKTYLAMPILHVLDPEGDHPAGMAMERATAVDSAAAARQPETQESRQPGNPDR